MKRNSICTFLICALSSWFAFGADVSIELLPQRSGKLLYEEPNYTIHEFRDQFGKGGCLIEPSGSTRLHVTVIMGIDLTEKISEKWMWSELRPIVDLLLSRHCPTATGGVAHLYVKGVDMTTSGLSYPISHFPIFSYHPGDRYFSYQTNDGLKIFPKDDFPTHSIASAYFTFFERLPGSKQAYYRKRGRDSESMRWYENNDLNWFSEDPYLINDFTFGGADGSFVGLLAKRKSETARDRAIAASRQKEVDDALMLLFGFIVGGGEYIHKSQCDSAMIEGRTLPWYCRRDYPGMYDHYPL